MTDRRPSPIAVAIIDEEIGRLTLLAQHVRQSGYIALAAHGGHKALKLLALIRPDVVVIHADLTTGLTAADLCERINSPAVSGNVAVPIIVIARQEQPWFASGEQTLVSDYLILPFAAYQLIGVIRRLLKQPDDAPPDDDKQPADVVS